MSANEVETKEKEKLPELKINYNINIDNTIILFNFKNMYIIYRNIWSKN